MGRKTEDLLGTTMRDVVTGYEGMVTTISKHVTGCDTAWLTSTDPAIDKDQRERHFDVLRLEPVEGGAVYRPQSVVEQFAGG